MKNEFFKMLSNTGTYICTIESSCICITVDSGLSHLHCPIPPDMCSVRMGCTGLRIELIPINYLPETRNGKRSVRDEN